MEHECKFEDKIIEMHGDIKALVAEFRAMNGALRDTKYKVEKHDEESIPYRKKIDILWATIHTVKWAIGLLLGTGVLFKMWEYLAK